MDISFTFNCSLPQLIINWNCQLRTNTRKTKIVKHFGSTSTYQSKLVRPIEGLPDVFHSFIFLLFGQFYQRIFLLTCFESIHKLRELGLIATLVKYKLPGTTKLTRPIKVGSDYKKMKRTGLYSYFFSSVFLTWNINYLKKKLSCSSFLAELLSLTVEEA